MLLELHHPLDGFYRGTRFDRGGVFSRLLYKGVDLCGEWYQKYDPFMHDAVLGPAEEFSMMPFRDLWLKPGVGLLKPDGQPYDRFKLYQIVDPGQWEVDGMRFRHILEGCYDYRKEIELISGNSFIIRHSLTAQIPFDGDVYNHNFFTMGKLSVGPSREIDFPFVPDGSWRAQYTSVAFVGKGIRFARALEPGESVYTGDIHQAGKDGMPYEMTLKEGPLSVQIKGDVPVFKTVMWANHRIACLEPYNKISLESGETLNWNIEYTICER